MLLVFQVCFFVGICLILLSFLFGSVFDVIGIDGLDLDLDLFGLDIYVPASPMLFILFATVFGGIGWILLDKVPVLGKVFIILISVFAGLIISSLIFFLVMKPLKKAQNTSAPDPEEIIGIQATVIETIASEGFGEIRYVVNGNSYSAPAKATNGREIKAGKEVAICWVKEHVFYVVGMDDM